MKTFATALAALATVAAAAPAFAQAGLLSGGAERLPPITLSSGQPLAAEPYALKAGKYYRLPIRSDGSAELGLSGAEFFRNVWVNEITVNDIEIRPLGVDSLEFDAAGEATITFIPIRPGRFVLRLPGTTGETQQAVFEVTD